MISHGKRDFSSKMASKISAMTRSLKTSADGAAASLGISVAAVSLFAIAWSLIGLAGFVYSLICTGKTPSVTRAILGVVIAIFFGPLYWVYWYADKTYCRGPHRP